MVYSKFQHSSQYTGHSLPLSPPYLSRSFRLPRPRPANCPRFRAHSTRHTPPKNQRQLSRLGRGTFPWETIGLRLPTGSDCLRTCQNTYIRAGAAATPEMVTALNYTAFFVFFADGLLRFMPETLLAVTLLLKALLLSERPWLVTVPTRDGHAPVVIWKYHFEPCRKGVVSVGLLSGSTLRC